MEEDQNKSRHYCPECEPNADPSREILRAHWCVFHAPSDKGTDDGLVTAKTHLNGSAEAGGKDNARWCALLHRGERS